MKPEKLKTGLYLVKINKAYRVYSKLFGKPKTHQEWCDRFNKVALISKIMH